jgi:hypothetical protein
MGSLYKAGREVKAGKEDLLSIVPLVWFKFCLLVFVLMEIEIVRQWAGNLDPSRGCNTL